MLQSYQAMYITRTVDEEVYRIINRSMSLGTNKSWRIPSLKPQFLFKWETKGRKKEQKTNEQYSNNLNLSETNLTIVFAE